MFRSLMTAFGLTVLCASAHAQADYPNRPIRLVLPYVAGGGTDVVARQYARFMSEHLKHPIVVENRPGAGSTIGAGEVARAAPDGYTILWGDGSTFITSPRMYKVPYDPDKAFAPITIALRGSLPFSVRSTLPIKDFPGFLSYARQNEGKLTYGSPGLGSPHHLFMEALMQSSKIRLQHVPYKGEAPAMQDVAAGQIDVMFSGSSPAQSYEKSGRTRVIGVSGAEELEVFKGVKPISKSGASDFMSYVWQGIAAPAGTPPAVIEKLNAAMKAAIADERLVKWIAEMGSITAVGSTPAEMSAEIQKESRTMVPLVQSLGIKLD